jgi:hypothetical protein
MFTVYRNLLRMPRIDLTISHHLYACVKTYDEVIQIFNSHVELVKTNILIKMECLYLHWIKHYSK